MDAAQTHSTIQRIADSCEHHGADRQDCILHTIAGMHTAAVNAVDAGTIVLKHGAVKCTDVDSRLFGQCVMAVAANAQAGEHQMHAPAATAGWSPDAGEIVIHDTAPQ